MGNFYILTVFSYEYSHEKKSIISWEYFFYHMRTFREYLVVFTGICSIYSDNSLIYCIIMQAMISQRDF